MGTRTWNKERAAKRIDEKLAALALKDIEIKEYVRETELSNIPNTVEYTGRGRRSHNRRMPPARRTRLSALTEIRFADRAVASP